MGIFLCEYAPPIWRESGFSQWGGWQGVVDSMPWLCQVLCGDYFARRWVREIGKTVSFEMRS